MWHNSPFFCGASENPDPGMEGQMTSKASSGFGGSVSKGWIFTNSQTEPGQPWVKSRTRLRVVETERWTDETWWRHHIETLSTLLTLCMRILPPVTGEFPSPPVEQPVELPITWDAMTLKINERLRFVLKPQWVYIMSYPVIRKKTVLLKPVTSNKMHNIQCGI